MSENFCKDCKWFNRGHEFFWCKSPNNGYDIVTGQVESERCYTSRESNKLCGPAGNWFEEKPKKRFFFF